MRSEADSRLVMVNVVVDRVVARQECIAEQPVAGTLLYEGEHAHAVHLEHVVLLADLEPVVANHEEHVFELVFIVAINNECAAALRVVDVLEQSIEEFCLHLGWHVDETGAGVKDGWQHLTRTKLGLRGETIFSALVGPKANGLDASVPEEALGGHIDPLDERRITVANVGNVVGAEIAVACATGVRDVEADLLLRDLAILLELLHEQRSVHVPAGDVLSAHA